MRVYHYLALDLSQAGPLQRQRGLVVAATPVAARIRLEARGWQVLRLRRDMRPLKWWLSEGDVLMLTQQLAALLKAGLPLLSILALLGSGHPRPAMRQLLLNVQHDVAQGQSLSQALGDYPQVFGELYVAVLAAGELSGALDSALLALVQSLSKRQHLKRQLRLALMYPLLILLLSAVLVLGLVWFVLPSFVVLYEGMGVTLPAATLWLLYGAALVERYGWLALVAMGMGSLVWRRARRDGAMKVLLAKIGLRLPLWGPLRQRVIVARWAHTFAMLYGAGVPLLAVLASVAKVSHHVRYEAATLAIRQQVAQGQSLYGAMRRADLFPELLLQLVLVGEEAGAIDELLYRAAAYYADEVDQSVALLAVWLEPLLLLVLGVVVGGVLLALYLPLFNIGDAIV